MDRSHLLKSRKLAMNVGDAEYQKKKLRMINTMKTQPDKLDSELRDRLFGLWRDGRDDKDRYDAVANAEDYIDKNRDKLLTTEIHKAEMALLERLRQEMKGYVIELTWKKSQTEYAVPLSVIEAEKQRIREEQL